MTAGSRMDKLFSALSARERAIAVLQAWKENREEDPEIRKTMPNSQVPEFNHYIELMNAVNQNLGRWLVILRTQVEQLGLISGWLATLKLWALRTDELAYFIFSYCPVPITATEYKALQRQTRARQPRPDRGLRYEVRPDAEAKDVAKRRAGLDRAQEAISKTPFWSEALDQGERSLADKTYNALVDRLARQVPQHWLELRSVEILFTEAVQEFGEDAAIPEVREIVDWLRRELTDIRETLKSEYQREVELCEPDEAHLDPIRKIAHWPEAGSVQRSQ